MIKLIIVVGTVFMFWKYNIFTIDTDKGIYSYNSKNMSVMMNDVSKTFDKGVALITGTTNEVKDTVEATVNETKTTTKKVEELKPVVEVEKRVKHLYKDK